MQKISRRHNAIKLVTEISPTLINSRLVLDSEPYMKHLDKIV